MSSFFRENSLPISVDLVIVDRECGAENIAIEMGISSARVDLSDGFEVLIDALLHVSPDVVVTNVHRILPLNVIDLAPIFVNLHYSILPAFKGTIGMKSVAESRKLGRMLIGATCHLVNEHVDSGEVLAQGAMSAGNSEEEDVQAVFELGWRLLVICIAEQCGVLWDRNLIEADWSSPTVITC